MIEVETPALGNDLKASDLGNGISVLLLSLIVACYILCFFISGIIPQSEMLAFSGRVPIVPFSTAAILGIFGAVILIRRGRYQISSPITVTGAIVIYAVFEVAILSMITKYDLGDIRRSLASLFSPLIIAGLSYLVPVKLKDKYLCWILGSAFSACFVFSALQFFLNDAVIPTESIDGNFYVYSYTFNGQVRGFSLFDNGLNAGVFYCLIGSIGTSFLLTKRRRILGISILALSAFGCYATLTRLTMFGFVFCVLSVWALRSIKTWKIFVRLLPLTWLLCGILVIGGSLFFSNNGKTDITSSGTIETRIAHWAIFGKEFADEGAMNKLFGSGTSVFEPPTHFGRKPTAAIIEIDNGYLQILLNVGIVGLGVILLYYIRTWSAAFERSQNSESHIVKGATAFFATVPFFCCINDLLPGSFIILAFAMFSSSEEILGDPKARIDSGSTVR